LETALLVALMASSGRDINWMFPAAGACLGVYLFYRGFAMLARRRLILNTPTSKVRSASLGLVELNGLASGPNTLYAPITGLPCYYYRTVAWQLKSSSNRKNWTKVADETMQLPFYLDDNSGRVLIDPSGAEMDIHHDFHCEYGSPLLPASFDLPGNVLSFLSRYDVNTDQRLRVEEYCIKPKNSLFILGTLAENTPAKEASLQPAMAAPSNLAKKLISELGSEVTGALEWEPEEDLHPAMAEAAIRSGSATEGALPPARGAGPSSGPPSQEKIAAALMKAGITNPAAWAVAGVSAASVPPAGSPAGNGSSRPGNPSPVDPRPAVILAKGSSKSAFFISWRSQQAVVKSLAWKSALLIWGSPLLTLACAYYLLVRFDLVPGF
jgi:hypothetical protein